MLRQAPIFGSFVIFQNLCKLFLMVAVSLVFNKSADGCGKNEQGDSHLEKALEICLS
jgi:hypothetical protein